MLTVMCGAHTSFHHLHETQRLYVASGNKISGFASRLVGTGILVGIHKACVLDLYLVQANETGADVGTHAQ